MPSYDADRFRPPAPLALVTFVNTETGQTIADVPMLLDSGAYSSVVSVAIVEALGCTYEGNLWEITSFAVEQNLILRSAKLQMRFERFRFNSSFLVDDVAVGIVGRNILNLVTIRFDGPRLTWQLD